MIGLTHQMRDLLDFITTSTAENRGVSPSYAEMMAATGLKSKSNIHRLLKALEERQYIRRIPNRARAIEVLPVNRAA
jgi:repressor LexA